MSAVLWPPTGSEVSLSHKSCCYRFCQYQKPGARNSLTFFAQRIVGKKCQFTMELPKLRSFAIFDGVPPQQEGEDPTIFWWYPSETPIDDRLNQIGLYLTFIGFCRDFRASQDCQHFQTDQAFSCFASLGANVYALASFATTDEVSYRVLCSTIELFASMYRMFFGEPYRLPDNKVDKQSQEIFRTQMDEMIRVFSQTPFLSKMAPSSDLWTICEEAIACSKERLPHLRSIAFIFQNRLVHTTMSERDVLTLYAAYRCPLRSLLQIEDDYAQSGKLTWVAGVKKGALTVRKVHMADGPGFPVFLKCNSLLVIVVFAEPRAMTIEEFQPVEETLAPFIDVIRPKCESALSSQRNVATHMYRDNGMCKATKPMEMSETFQLGFANTTEKFVRFMKSYRGDFVRFAAKSAKPGTDTWLFMERDGDVISMVDGPAKDLPDMVAQSSQALLKENIG